MIEGLRYYPEVVATEVGWLSTLPAHWQVVRAKHVFREVDCRSVDGAETHLSMHQKLGLVPSASTGEKRLVSESYAGGKVVEPDDLVLNRLKAHLGVFAHASQQGVISPDYTVLRPLPNAIVRYYEYLLKSSACRGELRTRIKGIVEGFWRLYTDDFYDIRLPVPSLDEQRLIVRFLDWHGAMTGKLIRAKRRLIALLNEQKQSIIHRAVTRGLDPAVKLKPSGVDWLGDVPEHWEVLRGKNIFSTVDVRSKTGTETLLTVSSRMGIVRRDDHRVYMFKAASYVGHKLCWPEDLVINSLWAWANGLGFSRDHGIISTAYSVYRLKPGFKNHWQFLDLALRSGAYDVEFQVRSKGIWKSRLQLTDPSFLAMPVLLPPEVEANAIVEGLALATKSLEDAINTAQDEITFIQEFRTRLIADVVTGQLDVRAIAASLPEVAEADVVGDLTEDDDLGDDADALIDEEDAA